MTLDSRIAYAYAFVRRWLDASMFRRNVEDIRQTAALYALTGLDPDAVALATLREFRPSMQRHNRAVPIDGHDAPWPDRCEYVPIPEHYFAGCTDRMRAALCLAYESDLDDESGAEALGCKTKTFANLLWAGRRQVAKSLGLSNKPRAKSRSRLRVHV